MIGRRCWRFRSVASTQNVAFRLAELGAIHGTVVRAEYQHAGRGRQGRRWDAPAGSSLMFSVLLRPQQISRLGHFSILTGHALAGVISGVSDGPVSLKWPNDVLIDGRKVSGILMQTRFSPDPVAVMGIGINVATPADSLPEGATSLQGSAPGHIDREALFASVLTALDRAWAELGESIPQPKLEAIDRSLWLRGQDVLVVDAGRQLIGTVLGIAPNGGLRLLSEGEERIIVSGELTRGPRAISS